jgi:hypothetical protein
MNIEKQVAKLEKMSVNELRERFAEVCGETTIARNKTWLVRRIAWRLQANAEGGLSERALARARELANDADLRVTAPRAKPLAPDATERTVVRHVAKPKADPSAAPDARLPIPGTVITREYKGRTLRVKVLPKGLEYEGETYNSLSAVAKAITGSHCNGFLFFRLIGGAK